MRVWESLCLNSGCSSSIALSSLLPPNKNFPSSLHVLLNSWKPGAHLSQTSAETGQNTQLESEQDSAWVQVVSTGSYPSTQLSHTSGSSAWQVWQGKLHLGTHYCPEGSWVLAQEPQTVGEEQLRQPSGH
jgi:hypothetical protein